MIKDLCRTVHLAQNDYHLIVDELLKLSQVTRHVHLQLCSDLRRTQSRKRATQRFQIKPNMKTFHNYIKRFPFSCRNCICLKGLKQAHLFAGDVLQILLSHDFPQAGFYLSLCPLSLCRAVETLGHKSTECKSSTNVSQFH